MKNQQLTIQDIWDKTKTVWKQISNTPKQSIVSTEENNNDLHVNDGEPLIDTSQMWGLSFVFWFAGVLAVYVGYLLFSSLDLVYLIFAGYILSMAMEKMIVWFTHLLGGSRGRGIFISYFIFVAVLLSGVLIMLPFLGGQISDIGELGLKAIDRLQVQLQTQTLDQTISSLDRVPSVIKTNLIQSLNDQSAVEGLSKLFQNNIQQIASKGSSYIQGAGGVMVNVISSVFNALTQVGFAFTLAVLFSVEKDAMMRLIRRIDRKNHTKRYHKVSMMYEKLGFWLRSQLILCLFIFAMTGVGLLILSWCGFDIPNILSLAIIAGLTEVVPYVGPLLGSVPALLVGTINNGGAGFIWVGLLFFIIQWTENNILIPWIMNKTLGVSSLLIFICMLIGASTLGFVGVLLAVPIAIIISISMEES